MGLIQSQERRGQLTKIERRMVQAMAERAQKVNVTLKTFNTFILKFPKIDASFEAVREVFNKAGLETATLQTHLFKFTAIAVIIHCLRDLHLISTSSFKPSEYPHSPLTRKMHLNVIAS